MRRIRRQGRDVRAAVVLAEELARSTFAGITITILVHTNMASPHLALAGNEEQKRKVPAGRHQRKLITGVCVTEATAAPTSPASAPARCVTAAIG